MEKMKNLKVFTSIRTKLFISLCVIVLLIIISLILLNNFVLGNFYLYNKKKKLNDLFTQINYYYNNEYSQEEINKELEKISIKNDFDILIKNDDDSNIYISSKDFFTGILQISMIASKKNINKKDIIEQTDSYIISEIKDEVTNIKYIILIGSLDNNYKMYVRMPVASIEESVKISNKFLYIIAIFVIILGGITVSIVSRRFSKPIEQLNDIAEKMSNLDFSQKYIISENKDEIDNLGMSINKLYDKAA